MMPFKISGLAAAISVLAALAAQDLAAQTASAPAGTAPEAAATPQALPTINVRASADASAEGLSPAYAGGQVARGGRAGILGTRDNLDTPVSITAYTNELIQDRQARGIGDVLQNDPTVRVARGFGNFQESYFIRGFILSSDDMACNGLYGLLPRQYISTELIERVEVLRGASAFLNGANPGGGGIGGAINLLPKRAPNEALSRVTFGITGDGLGSLSTDIARRFGPDQSTGIRVNAAVRDGGTGVDDENVNLGVLAVGVDWRSRDVRLSGGIGWQDHQLRRTRPNVTLSGVTSVPDAPDADANFSQPWSYSNERDVFGTFRGEYDITPDLTAWGALGMRRSDEDNSLGNVTVRDGTTGAATFNRFDNTRKDSVNTAELGLRGKWRTGSVAHEWVASASYFELKKKNAYAWDFFNDLPTNLYDPVSYAVRPAFTSTAFSGNVLASPALNGITRMSSLAVGDTLSMVDDKLLVTLGLRHQSLYSGDYAYGATAVSLPVYDRDRTSPMGGVVYKFSPQLSVYGNYVEGLTQGQTAPTSGTTPPSNAGQTLAPYVSRQKEVGLKYDGGRLGGGLALFSTSKPRDAVTAGGVYASEGQDVHQGLELTVQGVATQGLRLLGGATWLDAKQDDTQSATTDGKRTIGVPKFQATLGAEWDVPGVRGLAIDGRLVHTGSSYADAINTLKVPSWTRLDVGARYLTDLQGHVVTIRARIDNLTDRDYWASVGGYPANGYLSVGAPRTVSLSASVDF